VCFVIDEFGEVRTAINIALASPKGLTSHNHGFNYINIVILLLSTYPLKNLNQHYRQKHTIDDEDLRICHFCLRVETYPVMKMHCLGRDKHEFSGIQNWGYFEQHGREE